MRKHRFAPWVGYMGNIGYIGIGYMGFIGWVAALLPSD